MRAIELKDFGGPEQLIEVNVPKPIAGRGQVVVRIHATSFNPVDIKRASGKMRQAFPVTFPFIPGGDLSSPRHRHRLAQQLRPPPIVRSRPAHRLQIHPLRIRHQNSRRRHPRHHRRRSPGTLLHRPQTRRYPGRHSPAALKGRSSQARRQSSLLRHRKLLCHTPRSNPGHRSRPAQTLRCPHLSPQRGSASLARHRHNPYRRQSSLYHRLGKPRLNG